MQTRDEAARLAELLKNLEPLEAVPDDISARYTDSLMRLSSTASNAAEKKRFFIGANQFTLAASFVLVFAGLALVTVNSGNNSGIPGVATNNQQSSGTDNSDTNDDQTLVSNSEKLKPEVSLLPVKTTESAHDYAEIPEAFYKSIGVGSAWNSISKLDPKVAGCLKSLELDKISNLIDIGTLNTKPVQAIWSPISSTTWNVYLVDLNCVALDKKYVSK